jgi:hypothetical protein
LSLSWLTTAALVSFELIETKAGLDKALGKMPSLVLLTTHIRVKGRDGLTKSVTLRCLSFSERSAVESSTGKASFEAL